MSDFKSAQKSHHKKHSGAKLKKKKPTTSGDVSMPDKQRNPKAFAFHSVNKVARSVKRTLDIKERKQHIPVIDRTPLEPPPVIVAIVGPPKVGKTTLMQCMIKNFTREKLSNIKGPVTVVSGKHRRLTFIECNNDINSMIDIAKIADLILLLVDASFGFEMEIFEFLNICQVHGFPKIMGVLTHLDQFKNAKALRRTKKRLKHRFWTEVYQGAKLFYLSGMVNEEYQKTEIHNLGRFISVMKFRPLVWRTTHPYLVVDRYEDITNPEEIRQNKKVNRSVCLYGYVRGTHLQNQNNVHIPGCGDHIINSINRLPDPCPLPEHSKSTRKRTLNVTERVIYAPFSGVGGIVYDKDAVYIDLGGSHSHTEEKNTENLSKELMSNLIETKETINKKMADSDLSYFTQSSQVQNQGQINESPVKSNSSISPIENNADRLSYKNKKVNPTSKTVIASDRRVRRKAVFNSSTIDDYNDDKTDEDDEDENSSDEDDEESDDDDESEVNDDSDDEQDSGIEDNTIPAKKKQKTDTAELDEKSELYTLVNNIKRNLTSQPPVAQMKNKTNLSFTANSENVRVKLEPCSDTESLISMSQSRSNSVDRSFFSDAKSDESITSEINTDENDDDCVDGSGDENSDDYDDESSDELSDDCNDENGDESSGDENGDESAEASGDESDDEYDDGSDDNNAAEMCSNADSELEENVGITDKQTDASISDDRFDDSSEIGLLKWKDNLTEKASRAFYERQLRTPNFRKLIYGDSAELKTESEETDNKEIGGLFTMQTTHQNTEKNKVLANGLDVSKTPAVSSQNWELEEVLSLIKDCFVTGKWESKEDAASLLKQDDELYGDFEDLEKNEVFEAEKSEESPQSEESDDENNDTEILSSKEQREQRAKRKREQKKARTKAMFNTQYDGEKATYFEDLKTEFDNQAQLNRAEFENLDEDTRAEYEGFRPGLYVRIEITSMPCEFIDNFDPTYPIIIGGLLSTEQNIGYVQARFKKHRWHKRILKTRDPLIVSLGWRRFQTIPLYSIQDHNMRNRLLKYTPEHLHCHASFFGPITPPTTGLLAVQTVANNSSDFRISGTGSVVEIDKSKNILKKLKLTGVPSKVFAKTAFIQDMFNSILEVAKFEGAAIRTVSGIRGQIKKALRTPEGAFRATFEDKIKMSDIVFVRTWYPVEVPKFYNVVTTLLLPLDAKNQWQGMKTVGQLKRERNIKNTIDPDHLYKPIERRERVKTPLVIPAELQKRLPFKYKPKDKQVKKDQVKSQRVAVIKEPHEKKIDDMMKKIKTLHRHSHMKKRKEMADRVKEHKKRWSKIDELKESKSRDLKKQAYRSMGKAQNKKHKKKS